MNIGLMNQITETSYLSTGNTLQYRSIMRIFYEEYQKMHFQLYKEEVFDLLKRYPEFEAYTVEQLKQDLAVLVGWKNITPIQDPRKVRTIEEYRNKQYRYTMSEYAVEIERLTVKLETLFVESGTLSMNLFGRIFAELCEVDRLLEDGALKEINEWWRNLQDDFKRLNQNYQDYLRDFYSSKAEHLLKSVEFLIHKEHFIKYLKEFVQGLQKNTEKIANRLNKISKENQDRLLKAVIKSELEIPRPKSETEFQLEAYISENVYGKWNSFCQWFLGTKERASESSQVMDITDEVIRKIIQNASFIIQMQNWGISKKEDYKKYIKMFTQCSDIDQAHCLSAHIFGIQQIKHYKANKERSTDSIFSSIYEEEPSEYMITPKVRTYKPRIYRSGFEDKTLKKKQQREEYIKHLEQQKALIMKYVKDGKLKLYEITDAISSSTRTALLSWISLAYASGSMKGRTEYGQVFSLKKEIGHCVLECEDGKLRIPNYVFVFEEEK